MENIEGAEAPLTPLLCGPCGINFQNKILWSFNIYRKKKEWLNHAKSKLEEIFGVLSISIKVIDKSYSGILSNSLALI